MIYPNLEESIAMAEKFNIIPICMEVYADTETPISLFKRYQDRKNCYLLESVEGGEKWARYSFIGINPFMVMKSINNEVTTTDKEGKISIRNGSPFKVLEEIMSLYTGPSPAYVPRFYGGAAGYFSYDSVRYLEKIPEAETDDLNLPDCQFIFSDEIIAFDHLKQKMLLIVNMRVNGDIKRSYNTSIQRLKEIYSEIQSLKWKATDSKEIFKSSINDEIKYESNMTEDKYINNVLKAKEYIKNGDIFQVVLSQRLKTKTDRHPFDVYRALRTINPSPYMFFINLDDCCIAGASPEMLLRVEGKNAQTMPIAGTRKRGATEEIDRQNEYELLNDEKEKAEHTMLVDLGRNDIGKVSKFGSVKVNDYMHVEKFSHVMHLVTSVSGKLRDEVTALDALTSVLPAGTLSGAPKVRAMEIINELEGTRRGPYGGAVGYVGFNGNLDTCITIRTVVFKGQDAYVQAGAGIVADSDPQSEYNECINKAAAVLKAFEEVRNI